MRFILKVFFQLYRYVLGPLLYSLFPGYGCRFTPTCSVYAHECISLHGAWKGVWFSIKRILRCHPFQKGGFDPPPEKNEGNW